VYVCIYIYVYIYKEYMNAFIYHLMILEQQAERSALHASARQKGLHLSAEALERIVAHLSIESAEQSGLRG